MDGSQTELIWNVYYHLYLDEQSYHLLQEQSQKLLVLSETAKSWREGKYGSFLRIISEDTLFRVHKMWQSYHTSSMTKAELKKYNSRLESSFQRAINTKKARIGDGQVLSGFRSTAPLSLMSITDLCQLYREFWDHGTTDGRKDTRGPGRYPNPMFAASSRDNSIVHYGTDPALGFHLATAYAALLASSPFWMGSSGSTGFRKNVNAAKVQFKAWSAAFRRSLPNKLHIRFHTGDALSFCQAVQYQRSRRDTSSPHLYCDAFHSRKLTLDPTEFRGEDAAPIKLNIIDTSNLLDHLGALNLFVAAIPLLEEDASATLYTETLVRREGTIKAMSEDLLCADFATVSILLGLHPVDY